MNAQQTEQNITESVKDRAEAIRDEAEETYGQISDGPTVGEGIGEADDGLPVRSVGSMAIFVTVFVAVYLATWALLGGIGLAVGIVTGFIAAALTVRAYARSNWSGG